MSMRRSPSIRSPLRVAPAFACACACCALRPPLRARAQEVQHAYHTNALLVKMLLTQAQANGLELHVDTNQLENEFLLKTIANSENVALSRPASDFVRRNAQLSKLGTVATVSVQDAALDKRNKELQEEVKTLTDRLARLQEQTTASMRDRSGVTDELNRLRDELAERDEQLREAQKGKAELLAKLQAEFASLSTQAAGAANASQSQFADLERQLQEQRALLETERVRSAQAAQEATAREKEVRHAGTAAAGGGSRLGLVGAPRRWWRPDASPTVPRSCGAASQVRQLKDVLDGKLQDAPQVKQLRQLMQAKSNEVVDLRKRLAKYEPQAVPSADNE